MPAVTRRSILRFGDGGLAVTLPKAWAEYYGLKPGDRVEVVTNGKLTLYPRKRRKGSTSGDHGQ